MTNMSHYQYNECQSNQLIGGVSSYPSSSYQYYQAQRHQQVHNYTQRPLVGSSSISGLGKGRAQLPSNTPNAVSDVDPSAVVKTQIETPEGTYKLMTLAEFSRPSRVPLNIHQNVGAGGNVGAIVGVAGGGGGGAGGGGGPSVPPPVRVSFASTLPSAAAAATPLASNTDEARDFICYNIGRELYVYAYGGASKVNDLSRPIDKRVYKGSLPTCHDFNQYNVATESCSLLVGFSAGQIQLFDPFKKDGQLNKLFNEERLIEKTRCTCVKWIPGSPNQFLVSHASGCLYVYNEDLAHGSNFGGPVAGNSTHAPIYQLFKQTDGLTVFTCKSKSSRNPVYKWTVGRTGQAINEFAFSTDGGRLLATVGQDGFLRIFNFHSMECVGMMRSYFGGLLCLSWSLDSKYIATGGEDDLISVYSVLEKRLVCRGQGHKSWVSQVAFDPYITVFPGNFGSDSYLESEEDLKSLNLSSADVSSLPQQHRALHSSLKTFANAGIQRRPQRGSFASVGSSTATPVNAAPLGASSTFYRLGSVGQDTLICLWDLTQDTLKPLTSGRTRTSSIFPHSPSNPNPQSFNLPPQLLPADCAKSRLAEQAPVVAGKQLSSGGGKHLLRFRRHFMGLKVGDKQQHATGNFTNGIKPALTSATAANTANCNATQSPLSNNADPNCANAGQKLLGSRLCPNLREVPIVEPLVTKKVALDRLTVLVFREDCFVTACQEGFVCTWARPDRLSLPPTCQQQRYQSYYHRHQQQQPDLNSPNPGASPNLLRDGTVV